MQIKSDFAILDVKAGRHELAKHFEARPKLGPCPENLRIPITITGYIDSQVGNDDGTSIEFGVQVLHIIELRPSIWQEVGSVLAGLDHSEVSPKAREQIRLAIERATGTRSP